MRIDHRDMQFGLDWHGLDEFVKQLEHCCISRIQYDSVDIILDRIETGQSTACLLQ